MVFRPSIFIRLTMGVMPVVSHGDGAGGAIVTARAAQGTTVVPNGKIVA